LRCGRSSGTCGSYHEPEAFESGGFNTRVADQATRAAPQDSETNVTGRTGVHSSRCTWGMARPIGPLIAGAEGAC
jgi:hypothetical protein